MRAGGRAWIAGALAGVLLAMTSATATAAEPGASPDVPGVVSAVTGLTPPDAPLSARVVDGIGGVELAVDTPGPVEVLGYKREPYLLFAGGVVYENRRSLSTYLNSDDPARGVPPLDQLRGPPDWVPVGSGPSWRWHDHRTHFGTRPSAQMLADPTAGFRIKRWRLLARVDGRPVEIAGSLDYRPSAGASAAPSSSSSPPSSAGGGLGPTGYALMVAGQIVLVAGILIVLRAHRRRRLGSSRA